MKEENSFRTKKGLKVFGQKRKEKRRKKKKQRKELTARVRPTVKAKVCY